MRNRERERLLTHHRMTRGLSLVAALAAMCVSATSWSDSIVNSMHNLSATGPGRVKSVDETEVCIFCHTPHGAGSEAPLWNRFDSGVAFYTPYGSSTAKGSFGQPTGASKLCLGCHDGTVALGMVRSRPTPIPFGGSVNNMPEGRSNLGTDLSDDHPVSFVYDEALAVANGQLHPPSTLTGGVRLDSSGRLQCTSCHDPHDDQYGKFLVMDNRESALCVSCHDQADWDDSSSHRISSATWNGKDTDPWPYTDATSVRGNACESCHTTHDAGTGARLLVHEGEEQNCFVCHNGNVAESDMEVEFSKFSVHPVLTQSGRHDPTEDLVESPRHAECADCHNPHAARAMAASAPDAGGALAGVKGITEAGSVADPVTREYELCFRCHAESTGRGSALVSRLSPETNTRQEFATGNTSYHPVVGAGRNADVPSLIEPYTESSLIYCTDCHNSDDGPGAGGSGPSGPHGSAYPPILERQLVLTDGNSGGPGQYALCYKCHSMSSILANESFSEHERHVVGQKVACTTCHDPHGAKDTTHLINFNTDYVTRSPENLRLEFIDNGDRAGSCSLYCHEHDHVEQQYPVVE